MSFFLVLQSTYECVQIGLYNQKMCIGVRTESKMTVSKYCMSTIENLLKDNNVTLEQISCIIANQGPGPFTSLRVVLATVNGLAYAKKIPLVAVNGMITLYDEYKEKHADAFVAVLLNAFNKDCYYYFYDSGSMVQGCNSIEYVVSRLAQVSGKTIHIVGNGAQVFAQEIAHALPQDVITSPPYEYCSLDALAFVGIQKFNEGGNVVGQIQPLYLKEGFYTKSLS